MRPDAHVLGGYQLPLLTRANVGKPRLHYQMPKGRLCEAPAIKGEEFLRIMARLFGPGGGRRRSRCLTSTMAKSSSGRTGNRLIEAQELRARVEPEPQMLHACADEQLGRPNDVVSAEPTLPNS